MGGSGPVAEVLDCVGRKMQEILKPYDFEPLTSDPRNLRWRNAAQWARNRLMSEGLLKNNSPRGIWEISERGRQFLQGKKDSANP
jgi:restriction endonuclease Mrr